MQKILPISLTAVLLTAFGSANAAITLVNSVGSEFSIGADGTFTFQYNVTNPNSVLAIGIGIDNNTPLAGVTFGGKAADGIFSNGTRSNIAYVTNPSVGGPIDITIDIGTNPFAEAYVLVELTGVDLANPINASNSSYSGSRPRSLNTTVDGAFIFDFVYENGKNPTWTGTTAGSVLTNVIFNQNIGAGGGGSFAGATGTTTTAGTYNVGWQTNGAISGNEIAVAFNPIPEPSTALLSGLAGLALLRRRRC